jgi:hypothetical protein
MRVTQSPRLAANDATAKNARMEQNGGRRRPSFFGPARPFLSQLACARWRWASRPGPDRSAHRVDADMSVGIANPRLGVCEDIPECEQGKGIVDASWL